MDKFNFLKDGAIKQLPPGFRFQPTDEEIVFQYLLRKIFSCPLSALIIPDIDISWHDPWDLPGNMEQDRYFFSNKEAKYRNGNLTNRATMSGYWKPTGIDKKITCPKGKPIILGMKKTLVFYRGKPCHASRTDWIMHEYRLVLPFNPSFISQHFKKSPQGSLVQIGNLVLCHISLRKRNGKNEEVLRMVTEDYSANQHIEVPKPIWFYDFMSKDLNDDKTSFSCFSNSVSSDASALTEVSSSSSGLIEHEEASNQFP
ncbi:NAC domain-containing protein 83-like [Lycium ferocissimum]|uniref:NAC domain-containing protein 83-like n=1 Tax=Lycium ferocissimum TaxID=112874 RepID=UPI0028149DA9|nr:NAC domain-containing protein 83-like [Lycium ferocissimum]